MSKCRHTNTQNQKLSVAAFQLVDGDLTDLLVGVGAVKGTGRLVALARVEESLLRRLGMFVALTMLNKKKTVMMMMMMMMTTTRIMALSVLVMPMATAWRQCS